MLVTTLLTLLVPLLALPPPIPPTCPFRSPLHRRATTDSSLLTPHSTLTLTNFAAFDAKPSSGLQSWVTFHYADTNSSHPVEGDCFYVADLKKNESIWQGLGPGEGEADGQPTWVRCGGGTFAFSLRQGRMQVQRGWFEKGGFVVGIGKQEGVWDGDVVETAEGKLYCRPGEWVFPVNLEVG